MESLLPGAASAASPARLDDGAQASSSAPPRERIGELQAGHRALALRIALAVSTLAVLWVFAPYAGWLVLAAWFASLARPLLDRLTHAARGRRRSAALLTLAFLLVVLAPLALVVAALAVDAFALVQNVTQAESGPTALRNLVSTSENVPEVVPPSVAIQSLAAFVRAHSEPALAMLGVVAGSLVEAVIGLMILFAGTFTLLVDGPALFDWLEGLAPASHASMSRLHDAFIETGRGLLIGSGLTGLVQALLSTIVYFALDVPRALVLGFLTLVCSLIPSVGTALVWVPVAIGLFLAGRVPSAIAMGVIGTVIIGGVDNLIRPFFVRWCQLQLSPFVVMLSVFGGVAVFGAWGILFGPIIVRLALEVLRICRDERVL